MTLTPVEIFACTHRTDIQFGYIPKTVFIQGHVLNLEPRPMAVLHYLIQYTGRFVDIEELRKNVWQHTVVYKTNSVAVAISRITRELRLFNLDHALAGQYGKGYCWDL